MISSLRGNLIRIRGSWIEIEVGNVGYRVWTGRRLLSRLHEGEEVKVEIYMAVSQDDIRLFGFETWEEVEMMRMLLEVSGVGPKTAAQIVGECEVGEIMKAVGDADVAYFKKIKGIGQKAAQKIIIELKPKIGGLGELDLAASGERGDGRGDDLYISLKQLGFGRGEIEKVVGEMPKGMTELEEKLQWCLQRMG